MPKTRKEHPLRVSEQILRFVNARLAEDNFLEMAFLFLPPRNKPDIRLEALFGQGSKRVAQRLLVPFEVGLSLSRGANCRIDHEHRTSCVWEECLVPSSDPQETGALPEFVKSPFCSRHHHKHTYLNILAACFNLAGGALSKGAVAQLQTTLRGTLSTYLGTGMDVQDQRRVAGPSFFRIRARQPLEETEHIVVKDGSPDAVLTDLQDIWYSYLCLMISDLQEKKTRLDKRGGHQLPHRPLALCPECKSFFFRAVKTQRTCGERPCIDRSKYQRRRKNLKVPTKPA